MKNVFEQITNDIEEIKHLSTEFFSKHTRIIYTPQDYSDFVIVGQSDYEWMDLDIEGKKHQTRLLKQYKHFYELGKVLISELPSDSISIFNDHGDKIVQYIEQSGQVWDRTTTIVINKINNALDSQLFIINNLYDSKEGSYIIVPDTNALLSNSDFESWSFYGINKFEILLIPTVTSELDNLKILHRNREVREKSHKIINRIKEYRRRGRLTDGVTLIRDRIGLRALAVEPIFHKTLSWLDINNNDDRFIATFLEVMKLHLNSVVIMVTADINLQNKAEFAKLPFMEPPTGSNHDFA